MSAHGIPRGKDHLTGSIGHSMGEIAVVSWRKNEFTSELGELSRISKWKFGDSVLIFNPYRFVRQDDLTFPPL
jgi:hypothetical protein